MRRKKKYRKRRRQIPSLIHAYSHTCTHTQHRRWTRRASEHTSSEREYDARGKRCREERSEDALSTVRSTCPLPPLIQCLTCFPGCGTRVSRDSPHCRGKEHTPSLPGHTGRKCCFPRNNSNNKLPGGLPLRERCATVADLVFALVWWW